MVSESKKNYILSRHLNISSFSQNQENSYQYSNTLYQIHVLNKLLHKHQEKKAGNCKNENS